MALQLYTYFVNILYVGMHVYIVLTITGDLLLYFIFFIETRVKINIILKNNTFVFMDIYIGTRK